MVAGVLDWSMTLSHSSRQNGIGLELLGNLEKNRVRSTGLCLVATEKTMDHYDQNSFRA